MEIKVEGMMCSGCERRVENAIKQLGIENVKADHNKGIVTLENENVNKVLITKAIEDIGFTVVE